MSCKDLVEQDKDLENIQSSVMQFGKSYKFCRLKFYYVTSWNLFRKQEYQMNKHKVKLRLYRQLLSSYHILYLRLTSLLLTFLRSWKHWFINEIFNFFQYLHYSFFFPVVIFFVCVCHFWPQIRTILITNSLRKKCGFQAIESVCLTSTVQVKQYIFLLQH